MTREPRDWPVEPGRGPAPWRYFPVRPEPLRMVPGLREFEPGGPGAPLPARVFQRDLEWARYSADKARLRADPRRAIAVVPGEFDQDQAASLRAVERWALERAVVDGIPGVPPTAAGPELAAGLRALGAVVQEDLVVVHRRGDADRAIWVDVSFPSGWSPERIVGASFFAIHAPVPDLAKTARVARSLVAAMVERGPWERFVWTLCADDELDHHPVTGRRTPWAAAQAGWLRVERQLTLPFPDVDAALFVIRTYVYPVGSLEPEQRATLRAALAAMPASVAAYKGLVGAAEALDPHLRA